MVVVVGIGTIQLRVGLGVAATPIIILVVVGYQVKVIPEVRVVLKVMVEEEEEPVVLAKMDIIAITVSVLVVVWEKQTKYTLIL